MAKSYENEYLFNILRLEYETTGEIPKKDTKRCVSHSTWAKKYGSWNKALQLAGIPVRTTLSHKTKTCELVECNNNFTTNDKFRKFCSVSCSNKSRRKHPTRKRLSRNEYLIERKAKIFEKRMASDFELLCYEQQRKRVYHEQHHECNRCKLDEWQGEQLTLEFEHKDGNNKNSLRENVEMLCPNCHSLTKTWRGRNRKKKNMVTDNEIVNALNNSTSIRQALEKLNLSYGGGNIRRIKKLLKDNNRSE